MQFTISNYSTTDINSRQVIFSAELILTDVTKFKIKKYHVRLENAGLVSLGHITY